jgi:hypothetical protein
MTALHTFKSSKAQETKRSLFSRWHESSWIRSKPVREEPISGLPFSPDLVPLAAHPAIAQDPARQLAVLAYRLLSHLKFTTLLELNHVNPVCSALGQGKAHVSLTTEQRNDALKIYCDEGGHALFVELFSTQVERTYGLNRAAVGRPNFDRSLEKMIAEYQTRLSPDLLKLFFVTISETLVTKILNDVPHDPQVAPVVRAVIGDHAADEALHSAYFRSLFPVFWHHLTMPEQEELMRILPRFLWAFLEPDRPLDYCILRQLGLNAKDAEGILAEVYAPEQVAHAVRQAAAPTLKMFAMAGVFELPMAEQVFADYELIA